MRKIAFNLQKGGTGKTTLAMQTAENMARFGRTVLIDFDPQGSASGATSIYTAEELESELADFFIDEKTSVNDLILRNPEFDFDIIPTSKDGNLAYIKHKITAEMIQALMADIAATGYEYCVLDTPPEMGNYINAILRNCDEVVTPIEPSKLSVGGVKIFIDTVSSARKNNPALKYDKIILNNYNRAKAKDIYFLENLPSIFTTYKIYNIPTSTKWDLAQSTHKPLYRPQEKAQRGLESTIAELERLSADLK